MALAERDASRHRHVIPEFVIMVRDDCLARENWRVDGGEVTPPFSPGELE